MFVLIDELVHFAVDSIELGPLVGVGEPVGHGIKTFSFVTYDEAQTKAFVPGKLLHPDNVKSC